MLVALRYAAAALLGSTRVCRSCKTSSVPADSLSSVRGGDITRRRAFVELLPDSRASPNYHIRVGWSDYVFSMQDFRATSSEARYVFALDT